MTPVDFEFLRKLIKERSGLVLTADKQYLLESRLLPIARKIGAQGGLPELAQRLRAPGAERLTIEVVEAMMTNETFFFRDKLPFDHFRDTMMPALLSARAAERCIRIWCSAASTGQEPYSLAIALKEMSLGAGWRLEILATDLSGEVLEKAKAGVYTQFEVQRGLPIQYLLKYFVKSGDLWEIAPEIRTMVQFRPLNLMRDFASLGRFDIVFCRNVLIYFDQLTKMDLLARLARSIGPGGYLVLGAAETVVGLSDALKPCVDKRGLYRPVASLPVAAAVARARLAAAR